MKILKSALVLIALCVAVQANATAQSARKVEIVVTDHPGHTATQSIEIQRRATGGCRRTRRRPLPEGAPAHLRPMIIAALDTGMRRGEMLALRFGDIDWTRRMITLRGATTKSRRTRLVPIGTARLLAVLGCSGSIVKASTRETMYLSSATRLERP